MKRNFFNLLFLLLMSVLLGLDLNPVLASNKSQDIPQGPPLEVYSGSPGKVLSPTDRTTTFRTGK